MLCIRRSFCTVVFGRGDVTPATWRFTSDQLVQYEGTYVDDVSVTN
jgi:hypothetical protein